MTPVGRHLVFPDGIRLARLDEIPGPEARRARDWARIESANIAPGYTVAGSTDTYFSYYAEANVDAPQIWVIFRELSEALLGPKATLLIGDSDDEPTPVGNRDTKQLLDLLEPHRYRLSHDGYLQFGLIDQRPDRVVGVFLAPTKHCVMWLDDDQALRSILRSHDVPEVDHLEFIDEYPHVTTPLPHDRVAIPDPGRLVEHFSNELGALPPDDS